MSSSIANINNINKNLNKEKEKKSSFILDFFLAGIAATIGKTATAPLERIKLLLQNQHLLSIVDKKYSGFNDCLKNLLKNEGFFSLWRGNTINVMRYFPNQALNFALKDTFKNIFPKYNPEKDFMRFLFTNCISGGSAAAVSLSILHPIDLVRTRLATDNKFNNGLRKFNGTMDCINKIYLNENGIRGFYSGLVVSVVGIFLYRALYFGGYDTLKGSFFSESHNFVHKWIAAQGITIISGMCMYPLDTVRRRIIIQSGEITRKYKNSFNCINVIFCEEGIKGFYKGFLTNGFRTCGSSLVLVLYDEFQKFAGVTARGSL